MMSSPQEVVDRLDLVSRERTEVVPRQLRLSYKHTSAKTHAHTHRRGHNSEPHINCNLDIALGPIAISIIFWINC